MREHHDRPVLDQFSEEGFIDCVFEIVTYEEHDAHYALRLEASFEDQLVGLDVDVVKGIKSGLDADANLIQEHVYRRGVVFRSIGVKSDRLLRALATLYRAAPPTAPMRGSETFTAIALHQGEIDMRSQPIKIKLFGHDSGESADETLYNETFFNLDLTGGYVFWNEKDPEYRSSLISALSR